MLKKIASPALTRQFLHTSTGTKTSIATRTSILLRPSGVPSTTTLHFISTSTRNMSAEIKQISTPKATQRKHMRIISTLHITFLLHMQMEAFLSISYLHLRISVRDPEG
jgi:hypothetical protein